MTRQIMHLNKLTRAQGFLAAFLTGAVAALGQAPFGFWWAALVGFALAFQMFLRSKSWRQAGLLTWAIGLGYFGVTMSWLVNPFLVDPERHGWMAPFALMGMAGGLALIWGVAGAAARHLAHRGGGYAWMSWAIFLSAAELLRGWAFTGFPWGTPGLIWIDTPLAQLASFVGVTGLTASTFALSAAAVSVLHSTAALRNGALWVSIGGLALALGHMLVQGPMPDDTDVKLRLVQPNAPQHLKWSRDHARGFVQRQLDLTAAPFDGQRPNLVIWPETSVPYLLDDATQLFEAISAAADGTPVALGLQRAEGMRYFNSLAWLRADATVEHIYDKHHLVPFGEYVPFGDALMKFGIKAFAQQLGQGYSAGLGPKVFDLGALGHVLPLICYEAIFPRDIRNAPTRPDWLLQVTNDAWFGTFSGPQQHAVQTRFRAIEFGLPLVRVANTGLTAVVDARGRITDKLPMNESGALDTVLPAALPEPLYARHGDLPLIAMLIGLAAVLQRRKGRSLRETD